MVERQIDAVVQPRHFGLIAVQHHSHTSSTRRQRQANNRTFRHQIARRGKLRNRSTCELATAIILSGNYPGLIAEFLTDAEVFPVCSPKLLKGAHPLRKPEDLKHHTLIRDTYPIDWAAWLSSAKVKV
jgi:hypothetical protein